MLRIQLNKKKDGLEVPSAFSVFRPNVKKDTEFGEAAGASTMRERGIHSPNSIHPVGGGGGNMRKTYQQ